MAIAFYFESDKVDQDVYDGLMKAIDRESTHAPSPDGFIGHLSGPKPEGGWRVVDLWDSEQAANAFYSSDAFAGVSSRAEEMGLSTAPWPMHRLEIDKTLKEIN